MNRIPMAWFLQARRPMLAAVLAPGLGLGGCGFKIEPDPAFVAATDRTRTAGGGVRTDDSTNAGMVAAPRPMGEEAVQRLLNMTASPNAQIRANALEGLTPVGMRIEPAVALALRDENPGVRSVAAMVAGRARLGALRPTIEQLLTDPSAFVRASAIGAVHALGGESDPSELAEMLLTSPNPRLRAHAAFTLGELGDKSALPMLREAWATPIRNANEIELRLTRLQVAEALIKLGDDASVDAVRAALYPSRPEELEATALAVQIIGEVGDRGSIDQLIYLADDTGDRVMPAEVRLAVAGALAKLGLTQGGFIADKYAQSRIDTVRAQAASVYGRTGQREHLASLTRLLEDPSELVRVAAAAGVVELMFDGATRAGTP
jgi:hypothetical protein